MAEIKSTRDLIMERTKHLTMTDEEKRALHLRELRGKIKGWVQKCIHGTMDISRLQEEIEQEKTKEPELLPGLSQELLDRIDPDGENDVLFHILESVVHRDTAAMREIIDQFRTELAEKAREKTDKTKNDLAQRSISGSAVAPNLNRDPEWKRDREALKAFYIDRIHSVAS